ncbi:MAG: AAA family ATPase [Lachnospiraceae bacterium]|nr:AAA family ATPase [Lachnospiraceae bacterium]
MQEITKIVITGGPCAGKTTAMSWIQNSFTRKGYTVLFVPETATELISGGVAPWTCGTNFEYQICQMELQRFKEETFRKAARSMPQEKILIVCDRGEFDNKAYMTDGEFEKILDKMGFTEERMYAQYDAVFHLVTAANGAEEFYSLANNAARYETPEQAVALDDTLKRCWSGHPRFSVIGNQMGFEEKMRTLITQISDFLGEKEPKAVKRKFLIEYPDVELLENAEDCHKVEVVRTYLKSGKDEEIRIRKRGIGDNCTYSLHMRVLAANGEPIETERQLTPAEYDVLLGQADPGMRQIRKKRYCFTYEGDYFELDLYSLWRHQAIVEVEANTITGQIHFPDYVRVIRELTGVPEFRNAALARR